MPISPIWIAVAFLLILFILSKIPKSPRADEQDRPVATAPSLADQLRTLVHVQRRIPVEALQKRVGQLQSFRAKAEDVTGTEVWLNELGLAIVTVYIPELMAADPHHVNMSVEEQEKLHTLYADIHTTIQQLIVDNDPPVLPMPRPRNLLKDAITSNPDLVE